MPDTLICPLAACTSRVYVTDFRHGESQNMPGDVALPNRDDINLLELPVQLSRSCV